MIEYLDVLIKEAEKQDNLALISILYTVCGAIVEDSLNELSFYTATYSKNQIEKYAKLN